MFLNLRILVTAFDNFSTVVVIFKVAEILVSKVFAEFSNSAKKRRLELVELTERTEFCEAEFHEVIRNVPTRWPSLIKAGVRYFEDMDLAKPNNSKYMYTVLIFV